METLEKPQGSLCPVKAKLVLKSIGFAFIAKYIGRSLTLKKTTDTEKFKSSFLPQAENEDSGTHIRQLHNLFVIY